MKRNVVRCLMAAVLVLGGVALMAQQAKPAALAALNEKDVATTQSELIKLLKLSPTLTTVVARDPSLLSNQDYVARNNPQLAQFLAQHPEVARNPEYFLFSHLHGEGEPDEALERAVWPGMMPAQHERTPFEDFMSNIPPVLALAIFLAAVAWLTRLFLENRRWNRVFKLQSEVHGRLIDKFSSAQELGAYMETDAGRKFLEASPIAVNAEPERRVPQVVARVLTGVQAGIVMVLLGTGCMLLRHASTEMDVPMLVLGTLVLMPGVGFIISAGVTWIMAARLGLMPEGAQAGFGLATKDRQ
ncbi:MAG: hypothetical protein P4L40_00270 [Terracidiphilus sp.]|nr:hypothetical protein [Terracidiphilus sp.]